MKRELRLAFDTDDMDLEAPGCLVLVGKDDKVLGR
jgi:hypothetical protein